MMCYALGALELFDGIYDINKVQMTIFQPRRDNVSSYSIDKEALLAWADEVLSPTAKLAYEGGGEFKADDHCTFCKVKATCRKRAEYNLELAKYDFEMPATLDEHEIAAILPKIVKDAGYNPYEQKLLGLTAMNSLLGKKKFEELLGGLVYKPPGKPVLVPESDKRPAMNTAADDFNDKEK